MTGWFCQWADSNLKRQEPHNKAAPQYHSVLTEVLSELATWMQNSESLRPVVAAQLESGRDTCGWYRLPPIAQQVILAASADDGLTIPSAPPPSMHRFLNARNATALQAYCALAYSDNNIFLPAAFSQDLP